MKPCEDPEKEERQGQWLWRGRVSGLEESVKSPIGHKEVRTGSWEQCDLRFILKGASGSSGESRGRPVKVTRATEARLERVTSGQRRILKVEAKESAERSGVGCERERRAQEDSQGVAGNNCKKMVAP